ncbi:MAG: hypothetical protein AB1567_10525 [bacterium]
MEDWERQLRQQYAQQQLAELESATARGLSPESGIILQRKKKLTEEEEKKIEEFKKAILQQQLLLQQQGYDISKLTGTDYLQMLPSAISTGKTLWQGTKWLGGLSKGIGLSPWGLPLLLGGLLFKKPLKRLFKKIF